MKDKTESERRKSMKEALEKCSETVNRTMLTLLAFSLFCLLTTFGAADRSLISPDATIKIPFADVSISFVGFLVVAPLLLVFLTIYLHLFYGYWHDLDRDCRAQGMTDTYPAVFTIDRRIGRLLTAFIFYWLAPLVLGVIAWKAAASFEWGFPITLLTVLFTAWLVLLQVVRRGPGRSRRMYVFWLGLLLLSMLAAVTVGVLTYVGTPFDMRSSRSDQSWERPLMLYRADLKSAWLANARLKGADLRYANLAGSTLSKANLAGANLFAANLRSAELLGTILVKATLNLADLTDAILFGAELQSAKLSQTKLIRADLTFADLTGTDFSGADLTGADLTGARLAGSNLTC